MRILALFFVSFLLFFGSASAQYIESKFDRDYLECSSVASLKARGFSDAMYLGIFYGCMSDRGHDVASLS